MLSSQLIKHTAERIGFHACGLTPAEPVCRARAEELRRWIAEGCHGEMDYLARQVEMKLNPALLVEGARTVVSVAVNYYPGEILSVERGEEHKLHLARYAYGTDYHEVVRQMLRQMMEELRLQEGVDGRCFVDTAPVDEKYWAWRCGIGWRGRNSQLIVEGGGSYYFLGELILTDEADIYDECAKNRCGTCSKCVDACPAKALRGDGTLDARRCLSYLTIEHRGELPDEVDEQMQYCFYGCDRCAEVCPWNIRFARATDNVLLSPRAEIVDMSDDEWRTLSVEKYRELFRKSAVKRAKYEGLKRNIGHCLP